MNPLVRILKAVNKIRNGLNNQIEKRMKEGGEMTDYEKGYLYALDRVKSLLE